MLVDLNAMDDGAVIRADVGIIGAGAAGIAMALQFLGDGLHVALIESGGLDYEADTQALYEGVVTGLDYFALDTARLRYFGGSTNHWGGQSMPLQPIDFAARDWVPSSGWPVSYDVFTRYLPRAEPLCRLTLAAAGQEVWEPGPEMPDLPLDDTGFEPVLLRYPRPEFSFGSIHRRTIEQAVFVRCYLHANATGFATDPDRRRITSVSLASLDGRRATLVADKFVLATGGIENCRLLLAADLGNEHDQVGRYVMEHPNYDTGLVRIVETPYLSRARTEIDTQEVRFDSQLSPEAQAEAGILNHSVFLLPQDRGPTGRVGRLWDRLTDRVVGPEEHSYKLRVRLEHAPNPDSRITLIDETDALSMPRVALDYRFGPLEARTVEHVCDAFASAVGMADLGRMQVGFDPASDWEANVGWQYHHCGGTRMSADPRHGVVDVNCRVHGIDNLYVAGSSIFPTAGHANPTMNLLAFAIRLADHLKEGSA
jgi:choline dehydrogenase-like flavoprotein